MIIQQPQSNQYIITLPKILVEAKGWNKGTKLKAVFNEKGNIVLEEVR